MRLLYPSFSNSAIRGLTVLREFSTRCPSLQLKETFVQFEYKNKANQGKGEMVEAFLSYWDAIQGNATTIAG